MPLDKLLVWCGTQVSAYPPFPGTEAHFLRAQLARIAASTVLCPGGYFTANEEGGLDKAEEFAPPAPTDYATAAAWAHRYPHLKKQGQSCAGCCSVQFHEQHDELNMLAYRLSPNLLRALTYCVALYSMTWSLQFLLFALSPCIFKEEGTMRSLVILFAYCAVGRTTVFTKEVPEGEEAPEPTEEEAEQGPEPLSTLDKDAEVEGAEAWAPLLSSTNSGVKNQVNTKSSMAYSIGHEQYSGTLGCW